MALVHHAVVAPLKKTAYCVIPRRNVLDDSRSIRMQFFLGPSQFGRKNSLGSIHEDGVQQFEITIIGIDYNRYHVINKDSKFLSIFSSGRIRQRMIVQRRIQKSLSKIIRTLCKI
ncbi:hypothetical protein CEXT_695501 [Caerostris extrusa]|uniref:Uncharacterized protein n=1 Tax=Caerostris extrusa TaxID=172846 RepID=A0AAV4VRZ4_CAEEX|nr:hypothetical protein CEXT_695501 [Caerostris extrusa]